MSYTGRISGPIIVVDNDDPVDAAPLKLAYIETLKQDRNSNRHTCRCNPSHLKPL